MDALNGRKGAGMPRPVTTVSDAEASAAVALAWSAE
jgi:hypothetical protein